MNLIDKKGNRLITLHQMDEQELPGPFPETTHSLVVGIQEGKVLFVFDNWKREWELPGGSREPGESPRECAIRELREETGKQPSELAFHSLIEWRLGKEQRPEFGALFTCTIAGAAASMDTGEIGKTLFWDLRTDISEVSVLDHTLAEALLTGASIQSIRNKGNKP